MDAAELDISGLPREESPSEDTGKDTLLTKSAPPSENMPNLTNGEDSVNEETQSEDGTKRESSPTPTSQEIRSFQGDTNEPEDLNKDSQETIDNRESPVINGTETVGTTETDDPPSSERTKSQTEETTQDDTEEIDTRRLSPVQMTQVREEERESPKFVKIDPIPVTKVEDSSEMATLTAEEIGQEDLGLTGNKSPTDEVTQKEPESDTQDSYTPIATPSDKSSDIDKTENGDKETQSNAEGKEQEEEAEEEAQTYLIKQEAEKEVMHELIDETVVLEKDIHSLETKLEQTEAEKSDLESQVSTLQKQAEFLANRAEQLETELKEAKMGDGDQRRLLEETQQRVVDLEDQLKRMAKDDEDKSRKLSKAEKELKELADKCRRLEAENQSLDTKQQSKTCAIM